jgi:hypothetical protein
MPKTTGISSFNIRSKDVFLAPLADRARPSSRLQTPTSCLPRLPVLPSDKAQWFLDWRLHERTEYDVKSHLPKFIKSEEIRVKVAGYILEDCVTYDARDAMLRYVDPGRRAQGVVTVSVRTPNFELDDIFLAFNGYKSPPPGTSPSPFNANVQQHKIFHEIFKILEVESTSDTRFASWVT